MFKYCDFFVDVFDNFVIIKEGEWECKLCISKRYDFWKLKKGKKIFFYKMKVYGWIRNLDLRKDI